MCKHQVNTYTTLTCMFPGDRSSSQVSLFVSVSVVHTADKLTSNPTLEYYLPQVFVLIGLRYFDYKKRERKNITQYCYLCS